MKRKHTLLIKYRRRITNMMAIVLLTWGHGISPAWSQNVIAPGTTFTVAPGTTVISAESLVIKSGSFLSNSGTLILKKDLTNEHAVSNGIGSGTTEFSGTGSQAINGLNRIQNLVVNNPAGITLGGNTRVNGILTLTTGTIALGGINLLLGPAATVAGAPSATAMVVATGAGELRKEFATGFTGSFTWPVGDVTATPEYSPVSLTFTGGTFATDNYAAVKLVNSAYTGSVGNYLNRYWTISQNGITAPQFNALFQYVPADVTGNESQIVCVKVDPAPIVAYDAASLALHQLTANALSAFGTFTGGLGCTLTVTPSNQNVASTPAGSVPFSVTSNCDWTAASNQTWCTINTSGSGNGTITANYPVNTSADARTANITVTVSGATPVVVTVTQAGSGVCAPPWQTVKNQQYNMNVIAKLFLSNVLTTNPSDAIGAFVGQECRGIAYPDAAVNGLVFLSISSNVQSGETVTFKTWKSDLCEECNVTETISFVNQSVAGSVNNPFEFHCGAIQECISFGSGYTWFSVNINPGSMALNSLFSNLTPAENDRIIGQQSFATYYGTQWVGSLTTIDPAAMYKMKLSSQQTWCNQGAPVSIVPINIAAGYTWIGYLPQSDLVINTALANMLPAPVSNDRFTEQSSFATYSGTQWVGTLSTLQKGKGYIIHLANSSVLTYASGGESFPGVLDVPPAMPLTATGEPVALNLLYNTQIIAGIILPDGSVSCDAGDEVYAYVGNECRGIAGPVSGLDGKLFLTVGSDVESGEEVTFRVYLARENRLYEAKNVLKFSAGMETGTMANPYLFNLAGITGIPVIMDAQGIRVGEIYPNPLSVAASLEFRLNNPGHVEGKLINGLGQVIEVLLNEKLGTGSYVIKVNGDKLPAGLYTVLLTYWNEQTRSVISRRMVVE